MTFSGALIPYVGTGVGGSQDNPFSMRNDWISYQGKIGSQISGRTTRVDIDDI